MLKKILFCIGLGGAFPLQAQPLIPVEDLVYLWQLNGANKATPECEVGVMTNNSHAFFIPAECNLPQFTSYVIRNECERNTTEPISISAYQGEQAIKTTFSLSKDLCAKVQSDTENKHVQIPENSAAKSQAPLTESQYVLQYFAGTSKPNPLALPCPEQRKYIERHAGKYFAVSEPLSEAQARQRLQALPEVCRTQIWLRPLYLTW